jgi:hypothetical protein
MKPFVNRMRLRLKALDLTDPDAAARLDQAQEDMWSILKKKKISRIIANQIIAETLDAAVNHRLESYRRNQNLKHLAQANSNLNRLIKHVERLAQMLAKLSRPIKAKLNKIMAEIGANSIRKFLQSLCLPYWMCCPTCWHRGSRVFRARIFSGSRNCIPEMGSYSKRGALGPTSQSAE